MNRDKKGLTVGTGLLILLMCIMLAVTAFISNYLPYKFEQDLTKNFTLITNATVYEVGELETDGSVYYGPTVEYWNNERGQLIHAKSQSTFKSSRDWQVGETVTIKYDPMSPGELTIDNSEERNAHFKQMALMGGSIIGLGVMFFIIGLINTIRHGSADKELLTQKYIKTPDGKTYEEWAEEQRNKGFTRPAEDALTDSSDKDTDTDTDTDKDKDDE